MRKIDLLCFGDTAVDVFIKIKDAHLNCKIKPNDCELCLKFASKVPYETATEIYSAGNSSNAAICSSKLGLSSSVVTELGKDMRGEKCLQIFRENNVSTEYSSLRSDFETSVHFVLWYGSDRTILTHHKDFIRKFPVITNIPKWIYVSSLGVNSEKYLEQILAFLEKNKNIKLAFQPGTYQINLGLEKMRKFYERSEMISTNKEEAERILGKDLKTSKIEDLLSGIYELGPKIVLITDGIKGAYMMSSEGMFFMPTFPDPKKPLERTGSGDAFTATFLSALILGKNPEEALRWAPVNAMSVTQQIGSHKGLLTRTELENLLKIAPEDYKIKRL